MSFVPWEVKAMEVCKKLGYEVEYPYGFDGGWVFVKDKDGRVFPVSEELVAKWIEEDEKCL